MSRYKTTLEASLNLIPIPLSTSCSDPHCKDINHYLENEQYALATLEAIESAAEKCLPKTGGYNSSRRKDILPGWNEHVKPYSEESKFWCSVWVSSGKPHIGYIAENMKHSRRQYKYAVRRLKKCNDIIQKEKFVAGILEDGRNIFDEVKKFRGKCNTVSSKIDDKVGAKDIVSHFEMTYKNLYNNVENDTKLDNIRDQLNNGADIGYQTLLSRINKKLVDQALKKLKLNKKDSVFDSVSDCYVFGPSNLTTHIVNLVRTFLVHGSVPNFILLCTLIPLVKDGLGDITSSKNYRAIAGGCLLFKDSRHSYSSSGRRQAEVLKSSVCLSVHV